MWAIWLVFFVVSVIGVAVPQALHLWAVSIAKQGKSGSEYIAPVFAPLFVLMPVFMVVGTFSAYELARESRGFVLRDSFSVIAVAFGLWTALSLATLARTAVGQRTDRHAEQRTLNQDEMIGLIRASVVTSFTNDENGVSLIRNDNWVEGRYVHRASRADRNGYQAYVDAANEARRLGVEITYHNKLGRNDPSSGGTRWISVDEARELLLSGAIDAFYCGRPDPFPHEPAAGDPTGLKLIDFGWVRHLYAEPELASTMVPIARSAPAGATRLEL